MKLFVRSAVAADINPITTRIKVESGRHGARYVCQYERVRACVLSGGENMTKSSIYAICCDLTNL
jgi:hypothetical protein